MILELRRRSRASGKVDAIYYMANKLFYTDLIGTNALDYCGGWLIRFEKRENWLESLLGFGYAYYLSIAADLLSEFN